MLAMYQRRRILLQATCDSPEKRFTMKPRTALVSTVFAAFLIGLTTLAWAVDMGAMKQKAETVKGQAENVKKEGAETTQSAKDMKAKDAMKNVGEMKDEGKKLKDAVTGK
jgi:hypothetical protein